jgi:hypothetical protein
VPSRCQRLIGRRYGTETLNNYRGGEEFVDETADLIDSLDHIAPGLELACGDPPNRLASLRNILDGAARAGMVRVNRLREGATAGVSGR